MHTETKRETETERKREAACKRRQKNIKKIGKLKITFVTESKGDGGVDRMVFFFCGWGWFSAHLWGW